MATITTGPDHHTATPELEELSASWRRHLTVSLRSVPWAAPDVTPHSAWKSERSAD